eukprot:CAMPEP_0170650526 /NCGR_PEP_ID=MMETSP0224-20130122/45847_1 /TAXON_ID=285029 /ORGANISM="Togula jolla, Strain CCCM 725" /LENGTH=257 /DNA_ID=CAMNT_0010982189 /DNA_START=357 /DNA_END=1131 /DNA_ORIENTATION=+
MSAATVVHQHLTGDCFETLKVTVPSLLYTVQNNLLFISLSNLSGAVYQVTYQLKILTTAILSVLILGKELGAGSGWQPQGNSVAAHGNPVIGLCAVLSACVTSGLAGVYLEKILKQTDASIWLRNVQLGLFGAIMGFIVCLGQDGAQIREAGFTQGYNPLVWFVILLQAIGGLVVAAVLKYADNILKCFGNALSIVISCVLSSLFLQEFIPDIFFVLGTMLVILATSLYSLGLPDMLLGKTDKSKDNAQNIQMSNKV